MGKTGWCVSGHHGMCTDSHVDTYGCDCSCHLLRNPRRYSTQPTTQPTKEGTMYELCKRILLAAENETDHAKIAEALDTDVETVAYVLRFYYIEDGELRTKKSPVRQYSPEYQCPSCKKHEGIRLPAEAYIDVVTDASGWPQIDEVEKESQFEVNDQGTASCGSCGHEDSVPAFVYKEPQA